MFKNFSKKSYNHIKYYLKNFFIRKYGITFRSIEIGVELTNYCNLRCAMCPIGTMVREKGYMAIHTFKKICDQSKKFRMPISWLSFYGEPLLYPMLEEALCYFKEKGFGLGGISTNGLLLDNDHINIIVKYCKLIRVAIDSTDKDVYKTLRNNDEFDTVCENIRKLISLSKNSGLAIEIQWLATRLNKDEGLAKFEEIFGKHDHVRYIRKHCGIYAPGGPDLTIEPCDKMPWQCDQPFSWLNICWDGRCVLCCFDLNAEQSIGNISDSNLYQIWHGKKALLFRKQIRKNQLATLPVCKKCYHFFKIN